MTVRANGVPCIARLRMPAGGGEEAEVAEEGGRAAGGAARAAQCVQISAVRNVRASGEPCIARLCMRMHVVLADLRTQQRTPVGQKEGG